MDFWEQEWFWNELEDFFVNVIKRVSDENNLRNKSDKENQFIWVYQAYAEIFVINHVTFF